MRPKLRRGGRAIDNRDGTATITWPDGTVDTVLSFRKAQLRTVGIWVSGLLASFIVGAFVGSIFDSAYSGVPAIGPPPLAFMAGFNANAFMGGIAGLLIFTCARLWLAGKSRP